MGQDDKPTRDETLTPKEWRQRYMDQLGNTINYVLVLSTASIGFCATQISQPHPPFLLPYQEAVWWLGASVTCGIVCSIVRLLIYFMRRKGWLPETGRLGQFPQIAVFILFCAQIILFGLGVLRIGYALV